MRFDNPLVGDQYIERDAPVTKQRTIDLLRKFERQAGDIALGEAWRFNRLADIVGNLCAELATHLEEEHGETEVGIGIGSQGDQAVDGVASVEADGG